MTTNLLLGSGFSRNWGGWLATEAGDFLFSCDEIKSDPVLKQIVWDHSGSGFEDSLEFVQEEAARNPTSAELQRRLESMQTAVSKMFERMNEAFFRQVDFEPHNNRTGTIREFLTWFESIFTLNQDMLLEHQYMDNFNVALESPRRWNAVQIPGMRRLPNPDPMLSQRQARGRCQPLPSSEYRVDPNSQPYFKLHGSSNWFTADGASLLVIGGGKHLSIRRQEVLTRYEHEFRSRVCKPGKLMIIGYGFRDDHINRVIVDAVRRPPVVSSGSI